MARRWRRIASTVLLGLVLSFAMAPAVFADVNDFTVTKFSADETLDNSDKQGRLHVVEHIAVDFTDYNHGITRSLPKTYKKHRLSIHINSVSSPSGAPASYSMSTQNGAMVIKIGSARHTVTGNQEYVIDYTEQNVISFYPDHDELYWDINGNGWDQQFGDVVATLHLPQGLKLSQQEQQRIKCYTGRYGSTAQDCSQSFTKASDAIIRTGTLRPLEPHETLTTVTGFQKDYFQPSTPLDTALEYKNDAIAGLGLFLLAAVPAVLYWYKRGRDPKGKGTIVPEYDAPVGLRPIEAGAIVDFKVDNNDITATLIDLAVRGYLKIIEEKKKQLIGHKLQYTLELRNANESGLPPFEVRLLHGLFAPYTVGRQKTLTASLTDFASAADAVRKDIAKDLTKRKYFVINPYNIYKYYATIIGFIAITVLFALISSGAPAAAIIGAAAGLLTAGIFTLLTPSRTAQGVAAKEYLLGLKLFLEVTQADRLQKLQGPDAAYVNTTAVPVKTVELFEKLLPYAMVLGVEKQWAKQFESLYRTPPEWYSGNWATFNAVYFVSSIHDGMGASVNSSFASSNSSSSGFGGGGAGGGGGGGGGGGW